MTKNQLLWKCRRGTKELDFLLSQFIEKNFNSLTNSELIDFNLLLDSEDPDLSDWLNNLTLPENNGFKHLIQRIQYSAIY